VEQNKPFFCWFNTTRMHVWTHLKKETLGRTGISLYADGMAEHDDMIGAMLDKLDQLGIADNTIVLYTTDNGAELVTWPDGGATPFHGEKGTTWEGGVRIPMLVRWPGVIKPGTVFNDMISLQDWLPTLLAAAGEPNIKEKLLQGHKAGKKTFKVHLDGYNFMPYFKGEVKQGPREEYLYFSQGGELNAVRWNDWKIHFAVQRGNIATGTRDVTGWPTVINLRADPYERAPHESGMYIRWYAEQLWLFVPVQQKLKEFFAGFMEYPYQKGSSLNAANISYQTLTLMENMKRLGHLEDIALPN
jgi:arylsulfatase